MKKQEEKEMKVFVCEHIHEKAIEYLAEHAEVLSKWEDIGKADAIIRRNFVIDKELLDKMPHLKNISIHGTGTDGVDLEEAKRKGIIVTTTPGENARSVAELAVTLMLALSKKLIHADRGLQKDKVFDTADISLCGIELSGKTLGLLGVGNIGGMVADMAKAFGMEVYGFSRNIQAEAYEKHKILPCRSLEELLKKADVLNISIPLNENTKGMIGEKELAFMKKSAFLINTARGEIVQEKALYRALKEGGIAGAACDVFQKEPPVKRENPLLTLDNFIATPHIGANTEEALYRVGMKAVQNIFA